MIWVIDINGKIKTTFTGGGGGDATAANQTSGAQKTQIVDAGGEAVTVTDGKLDVNASVSTVGLATSVKQDTGNSSLASIDSKITAVNTGAVVVSGSALPTGAANQTKQDTGNTSLASIDTKTPALGQALAAASTPVVLTAAQITTLTPQTNALTDTQLRASDVKITLDGEVVPVTGTFFQATQPVSAASLPLPTGAATAANQQTNAITDAQIRATPLPISGTVSTGLSQPLTDTQLRATPVPVSGTVTANTGLSQPLTDTQLRATPVPVSGTVTVDTSLLSTAAKQDTGNASLSSIDTKLTSQATAAKQDTGNTSLGSIDTKLTSQATASKQDSQTALLTTIDGDTSNLDVALSTRLKAADTLAAVTLISDIRQATAGNLNMTEASATAIKTAVETIDNFISGSRGLVTEDNSAAIKTAVEVIDNFISGSRGLVTEDNSASIKTAVEVIDNFISGSRGLVTEDNSAAILAKMPAVGQTTNAASLPVTLSSDQVFPAGFLRVTDEPRQILYDPFDVLDTVNTWALETNSGGVQGAVSLGTMSLGTGIASGGYAKVSSIASFKPVVPSWIGYSFLNIIPDLASPTTNAYRFWGSGTTPKTPTYSAPLTDAIGFELIDNKMYAVVYAGGTRTVIQDLSAATGNAKQPTDASGHRYIIYIRTDRIYFYIDSLANTGLAATSSFNYPNIQTLPMLFLAVAGAAITNSQIQSVGATVWDTGKNSSQISDGTYPWRKAKISAAGGLLIENSGVFAVQDNSTLSQYQTRMNEEIIERMKIQALNLSQAAGGGNYQFEYR